MSLEPTAEQYSSDLEPLIAECLDRYDAEGEAAIDAVCAQHPRFAAEIRAALARLAQLGLLGDGVARPAAATPPKQLGKFRLERLIGGGGMGVVYLATEWPVERSVALKIIRPEQLFFPGARERFRREIEAVTRLQHPNIAPVYSFGEEDGIPYFAMEWIPGTSLGSVIESLAARDPAQLHGSDLLSAVQRASTGDEHASVHLEAEHIYRGTWVDAVLRVMLKIAEAIAHAHERGVIHRDIKPSNILVTPAGRVLLVDFGLAQPQSSDRITQSGALLGSLPYMAPEQLRGEHAAIGERSDVYSLGATLYELLALRLPFAAGDAEQLKTAIVAGAPPALRARNTAVPFDVAVVCLKAMDLDPARRYASAEALARDLRNLIEHRPIEARPTGPILRVRRWAQRHPVLSSVLVLTLLLGVALNGWTREVYATWRDNRLYADAWRVAEDAQKFVNPSAPSFVDADKVAELERWRAEAQRVLPRLDAWEAAAIELKSQGSDRAIRAEELVTKLAMVRDQQPSLEKWLSVAPLLQHELSAPIWAEVRASIARSPRYGALDLKPQVGLRPLRENPRTGLWEFHHVLSAELVSQPGTGVPTIAEVAMDAAIGEPIPDAAMGVILVLVPGGRVWSGARQHSTQRPDDCPNVDEFAVAGEHPRELTMAPFFISKYELTCAQYVRITQWYPGSYQPVALPRPLAARRGLDWQRSLRHLRILGLTHPSDDEWEYACRGGATTMFHWGENSELRVQYENLAASADGNNEVAIIGSYQPNGFGLFDTLGNVREWCFDFYFPDPREKREEALRLKGGPRVVRGGSYATTWDRARASVRCGEMFNTGKPANSDADIGVRPARSLDK
ncbi:MAG: bifunctional serine/threonine-protein kinase/formylglycine-generating enzyme family protein [Planctomycetota bacterium]